MRPIDAKRNPELEEVIEQAPDNVEAYLIYGDWLQSQGDPRGELIALQCAAHQAEGAEATRLEQQASALLSTYKEYLLGDLANKAAKEVSVQWRFGFIQSASLSVKEYHYSDFTIATAVKQLMTLPSARFLRELTSGYTNVIASLAEVRWPTLRKLSIGTIELLHASEFSTEPCNIEPLLEGFPNLRSLKLCGSHLLGETLHLPELREFAVKSSRLPIRVVKAITKASWPELERLEVGFGSEDYSAGGGEAELLSLLAGKNLPKLKHLGLRSEEFADELCHALPQAEILKQLETLDLSQGSMTDEGAAALAANAAAFKHLKHLDVTWNLLTDAGKTQVARLCESVAHGDQRQVTNDDDYYRR